MEGSRGCHTRNIFKETGVPRISNLTSIHQVYQKTFKSIHCSYQQNAKFNNNSRTYLYLSLYHLMIKTILIICRTKKIISKGNDLEMLLKPNPHDF